MMPLFFDNYLLELDATHEQQQKMKKEWVSEMSGADRQRINLRVGDRDKVTSWSKCESFHPN